MGFITGLEHSLFGGESSSSSSHGVSDSGNLAYPTIMQDFGGSAAGFGNTTNTLGNLLGVGGSGANGQALNNYWNSAGGQFQLNQGLDGLQSKYASMGLSKSGAAMKGMEQFRQGLASTYLNNYLSSLGDLGKLQLGAGSLMANAGQYSHSVQDSQSKGDKETGGLGKFLGGLF